MNHNYIIMVIKKLIETTPNSLKLLGIGELTPFQISTLTPVSGWMDLINSRAKDE
jgi:hypothetical protein